jgi:hypothetical protein
MEIQYETLRLTRDAKGVLIVEFHSNRGPCTFSAYHRTEVVDVFHRIAQDRANKIVILTGAAGEGVSRALELADVYLKAPEVTRRDTRAHFIQPLKERIVREVSYGLSLEGASSAALVKIKATEERTCR